MKFKLDENAPYSLKRIIETFGPHQVDSVFHEGLTGTADYNLLKHCVQEQRILITLDKDFVHLAISSVPQDIAVIVLRPVQQEKQAVS